MSIVDSVRVLPGLEFEWIEGCFEAHDRGVNQSKVNHNHNCVGIAIIEL